MLHLRAHTGLAPIRLLIYLGRVKSYSCWNLEWAHPIGLYLGLDRTLTRSAFLSNLTVP